MACATKCFRKITVLGLSLALLLFIASCGSRKNTSTSAASRAAVAMSKIKSKPLHRFINDWSGTPYRLGGLNKKGIDCSGFALLLQKEIYNKTLPRRSRDQADAVNQKNLNNLSEGDLIFFSFGGREVDHVGIYLNGSSFVHASTKRGVVVDDLTLPAYQNAIVKTGTLAK
jgi:probable lipoprotein NlpC